MHLAKCAVPSCMGRREPVNRLGVCAGCVPPVALGPDPDDDARDIIRGYYDRDMFEAIDDPDRDLDLDHEPPS